jgi:hypothetical protein
MVFSVGTIHVFLVVGVVGFFVWVVFWLLLGWFERFFGHAGMLGYVGWDGFEMGGYIVR